MLTYPLQIQLKAEDLYNKEKVDHETIVVDDVFKLLQCDENGLTDEEATRRLELFGPNKLESEEQNSFLQPEVRLSFIAFAGSGLMHLSIVPLLRVEPAVSGHRDGRLCCHRSVRQ